MLEIAEVGRTISERAYKRALPDLREALLAAQFDLAKAARGPLLVLLAGIEGGGRSETANRLTAWMDPRHIRTMAFGPRTPEEDAHPIAWRYWRALPARGTIGLFMNAWYREVARYHGRPNGYARFEYLLDEIRRHETMLAADGFLILKLWFHLSPEAAATRLEELQQDRNRLEPVGRARKAMDAYFARRAVWEELLRQTSTPHAPWHIVEGADPRYRDLATGRLVLDALRAAAAPRARRAAPRATRVGAASIGITLLDTLDLDARMTDAQYDDALPALQQKLARLTRRKRFRKHALVLVFEGVDAAGKGGAIRRVTGALDARQYQIVPVSAPNEEEKLYPYLWRFWRHVPRKGGITLFDRSWYGRVLVERVEGYCTPADWHRAYGEINQFEENLVAGDIVICKFWLQVSKGEQLARFRSRQKTAFKQFKITADDWRNRKRWADYRAAANDMIERTSSEIAPWTLVAADDKRCARVQVLQTIVDRLDAALG
ncbi:MAG: polyphosphate:AMP phosphotransferase [Proteobacteria bacterium]|nr:polyphosphate:AMP phosphotransferase [Pseudomonadota bacterium]